MPEHVQIARNILPNYLGWLAQSLKRRNTLETARYYVHRDMILIHEPKYKLEEIVKVLHTEAA